MAEQAKKDDIPKGSHRRYDYCGTRMTRAEWKRRRLLLAMFVKSGDMEKARKAIGVSQNAVANYMKNPLYRAKIEEATEAIELNLLEKAYEIADEGSEGMVKFLLEATNPQKYDSSVRRQEIANQGQINSLSWLTKAMTLDQAREAKRLDPFTDDNETIEVTVIETTEETDGTEATPEADTTGVDQEDL